MEYQLHNDSFLKQNTRIHMLDWVGKNWFQIILILFAIHIFINKDVNIQINFNDKAPFKNTESRNFKSTAGLIKNDENPKFTNQIEHTTFNTLPYTSPKTTESKAIKKSKWKSADFNNLTFVLHPNYAEKKDVAQEIVNEKLNNCRTYVERFATLAISEMEKYGIPASIKLAQGLLETDAGRSKLVKESNNHFGIKCRSKCKGCTCRNYSDDDAFDMFRVFDTAWDSYREHSILLSSPRYQHLKKFGTKDYKSWATGVKKAGYATDKNYSEKLIQIIETLDLYQFDK